MGINLSGRGYEIRPDLTESNANQQGAWINCAPMLDKTYITLNGE